MSYNFDFSSIVDRKGHDALAVDIVGVSNVMHSPKDGFDIIPMWVADMNFASPKCITDAVRARLDHPFFGYYSPRKELYDGIISWQKKRNGMDVPKEAVTFDTNVLGGVTAALNVICQRGDNVLCHSWTYIGFSGVFKNNGYNPILSDLVPDENGILRMNYEDMEDKIVKNKIHAFVFCSPHNPSGRVWEKDELEKMSAICEKHHVEVISDEIWSDLILTGYKHIPTQSVSPYLHEHTVACYAPSKTFSLAGFCESYRIIYNEILRDKVEKEASLSHYNSVSVLSEYAHIGACSEEGMAWTDELCKVLTKNVDYAYEYILNNFDGVSLYKPQGTYLLYLDCTEYCEKTGKTIDQILDAAYDVGVYIQDGRPFHGNSHLRMNVALPCERLREAMERLEKYVFKQY